LQGVSVLSEHHSSWRRTAAALLGFPVALLAGPVAAQPAGIPTSPWRGEAAAAFAVQTDTDLDGGGSFSVSRGYVEATQSFGWSPRGSIGLSVGLGTSSYDFDGDASTVLSEAIGEIRDYSLSVPMRFPVGETATAFVLPSVSFNAAEDVDLSDGDRYGLLAGIAWRLGPSLTIGPGIGAFSGIEGSGDAFPFLLIDWAITDRLSLSTGQGLAASQGPGLTFGYQATETIRLGLAARWESIEFRLDDDNAAAPGGIGKDEAIPLVATVGWRPSDQVQLTAFAGAELNGSLTVRDSDDRLVERQDYDPAPIIGATIRLTF
jgi:hypothetical protein